MELQLPAVVEANERYRTDGFRQAPRTPEPSRRLVILTCMDARLDLFRALGLAVGDSHILRNAGGRASDDAVRSLIVSTHMLGTREIGVIHHTNCGLHGRTEAEIAERTGVHDMTFLAFDDLEDSVRDDVAAVRAAPLAEGTVVWGAVYDVDTAEVRVIADPA